MSIADHWMPLYVGDYIADTRHLTTTQHGAYLQLLMHQWRVGFIPDSNAAQARIVGLHHHAWSRMKDAVLAFFEPADNPGTLRQKRCHEERERVRTIVEKRSAAARSRHADPHVYPPGRRARVPPLMTRTSTGGVDDANPLNEHETGSANGHAKEPFCSLRARVNHNHSHREEKERASSLRSDGAAPPATLPDRDWVWGEGVRIVRGFTGNGEQSARRLLGKVVKQAGDDCGRVRDALLRAEDERPIDITAWLVRAVRGKRDVFTELSQKLGENGYELPE